MQRLERALERGTLRSLWPDWLTAAWRVGARRGQPRTLSWPEHVRVVTVGGATLGGSGKTPLAVACAAEIAEQGASAALVGHGYRATPRFARAVGRVDPVSEVGDEALVAARELAPSGGVVVVGPTRQAAVDFASRRARVLVLDGLAQTRPLRASLALLALDAEEPWGFAAALPPHGDLCAHPSELAYLCDVVVPIVDPLGPPPRSLSELEPQRPCLPAFMSGRGATVDGDHLLSWNDLSRLRVGLLTAIARPDRLVRWLTRRGVCPEVVLSGPDHGPLSPSNVRDAAVTARAARIAFWLASPKCSVHAERVGKSALGAPIALLEHKLALSPALTARLRALAAS